VSISSRVSLSPAIEAPNHSLFRGEGGARPRPLWGIESRDIYDRKGSAAGPLGSDCL
jgi:hypothetical protein